MKINNKKGFAHIFPIILMCLLILCGVLLWKTDKGEEEGRNLACEKIGLEYVEYAFGMGVHYCKDNMNQYHFIEMECCEDKTWGCFIKWDCVATEVTIGDVRVG